MKRQDFMGTGWVLGLIAASMLMWLLLGFGNVYWSDLNQDEGWYLHAADRIVDGQIPYRDFAFTQGPVMPYIYSLFRPGLADTGLVGMRWLTLFLFLPTIWLAAATTFRAASGVWRIPASLCCLMLVAINAYHSQYTSTVKTYSICLLLLTGGIALMARANSAHHTWSAIGAGFLMGAAACARLSAGFFLAGVCMYALLHPALRPRRIWFYMGLGGVVALATILLPLYWIAPDQFLFCLFEYHTGRNPGSLAAALVYKAGFLSRFVGDYLILAILGAAWLLLLVFCPRPRQTQVPRNQPLPGMLLCGALMMTVVHAMAPFPYDDYQVITIPAFAIAVSLGLAHVFNSLSVGSQSDTHLAAASSWARVFVLTIFLACSAAAWSSPVNQNWVVRERDRIWWRLKGQSPVLHLQEAAATLRQHVPVGSEVLTQDLYLAVEAGLRVPHGLEMGPFSYYPAMASDRAKSLGVLNQELLLDLLHRTEAPAAALSGYSFTIESPGVTELDPAQTEMFLAALYERYEPIESIPHFGQGFTTLQLLAKKAPRDSR